MSEQELSLKKEEEHEGLPEEDFSALLSSVSTLAPLFKSFSGLGGKGGSCSKREALLLALRPYLSPTRAAAVDYLIRIGRIGDALRALS